MHTIFFLSLLPIVFIYLSKAANLSDVPYPVGEQLPLIARVGQSYSWSISPSTFGTEDDLVTVSSKLPTWLSFSNLTFSGTPNERDEGVINVTLASGGSEDSFQLCVTHFPPPTLNIPISAQFNGSNPSMSSVFFLGNSSALQDNTPAVRIPLRWSFSLGFDYGTYVAQNDLFYYAQQADGSPLPSWISFDSNTVTFDGVTRAPPLNEGDKVSLVFIASDQAGYSAIRAPFDIFVDSHDVSADGSLMLNLTAGQPFAFDLSQNDWFFNGITIDHSSVHAANLTSLSIDTSSVSWLSYDNFTFSGTAPSKGSYSFPITLEAFNQSLSLNASVALLPSYFQSPTLPGVLANRGAQFKLPISRYFSNDSDLAGHDISLSASSSASYLNVTSDDDGANVLTGQIPTNPGAGFVDVELTAYDHTTHAASHASLRISFKNINTDATSRAMQAQRRRLVYGLSIGLGGSMALILVAGGMAVIRKCCSVPDTAVGSGPRSNSEKPRDLFDQDLEKENFGWSEKAGLGIAEIPQAFRPYANLGNGHPPTLLPGSPQSKQTTKAAFFNNIRTAVRNFSSGSHRNAPRTRKSAISRPFVMNPKVSNDSMKALRAAAGLEDALGVPEPYVSAPNSMDAHADGISLGSGIGTTPTVSLDSNESAGKNSIPRQRPGFGLPETQTKPSAPRHPGIAHVRGRSMDTATAYSPYEHDDELEDAVIVTDARAMSMRSVRSSSYSYLPSAAARDNGHGAGNDPVPSRPRLVQFTSERGVPTINHHTGAPAGPRDPRRQSLAAAIVSPVTGMALDPESDAILNEGMRYVRAFGDQGSLDPRSSIQGGPSYATGPTRSNSKRSSRSTARTGTGTGLSPAQTASSYVYPSPSQSLKSGGSMSRSGSGKRSSKGSLAMSRILVRTGERFAFKYPISITPSSPAMSTPSTSSTARQAAMVDRKLIARPLNGGKGSRLPAFLLSSVSSAMPSPTSPASNKKRKDRYELEFWGTPAAKDVGEVTLGIFCESAEGTEECVGKLVIEVVLQRR